MTKPKHDPEEARVRPFADFLREQNKGKTHEELSEQLHALIARIGETGKKGQLVLVINVEPNKKNPEVLQVTDEVRVKYPQPERKASIFYTDDEGNLSRSDPNQLTFDGPLRQVAEPETATSKETKQA